MGYVVMCVYISRPRRYQVENAGISSEGGDSLRPLHAMEYSAYLFVFEGSNEDLYLQYDMCCRQSSRFSVEGKFPKLPPLSPSRYGQRKHTKTQNVSDYIYIYI